MTPEQVLDKQIMLYCGKRNWLCFHINVGKIKFFDTNINKMRYFETGVPIGWPDLMVITDDGRTIFCETKIKPRKPTQSQLDFISELNRRGFKAFVAYNLNEFINEVSG